MIHLGKCSHFPSYPLSLRTRGTKSSKKAKGVERKATVVESAQSLYAKRCDLSIPVHILLHSATSS